MAKIMRQTLREQVTQAIRMKLLTGELKPGTKIVEQEMAEELGVSRGPVREALRQIEQEGLVEYTSHVGCSVKDFTAQDVYEVYLLRANLEILSVKMCEGHFSQQTLKRMEEILNRMDSIEDLEHFDEAIENAQDLKAISEADWKKVEDKDLAEYADYTEEDWDALISSYETILDKLDDNHKDIQVSYSFFTIDLSKSPANGVKIAIIIPILSALAQLLNMKISMSSQQNTGNGTADSMMSSMKVMSYSMCVVSAIFCYTFPAGLGLYWVISSAVQVVIQLILNKKFANMDTDQIIKQSIEKANRKRAKKGLPPNTISTAAATNTRNYKPQTTETNQNTTGTGSAGGARKGSISEKANLNKKYMDKK